MQQDHFDRNMKYNYDNAYIDNMHREASFNEDNRRWDIQNDRAAQEHEIYLEDAEIERKTNVLSYALQLAEMGDYSLLKEVVPDVSEDELKRRVQMLLYGI